ncbi:aldo/keto reductase [Mucilaginibacter arboris]|uniref:Aldo/keto reductase n=1 Tax=Mucilaginibacter arboris TaxID=2682090 RepID=A0A7K1T089_9SPHI|nr:aldo/keto reductase [Mucilaginibacter arboris]MVN22938.1 aldo/keto reductase [Mucilaginibacter arboris]
MKKNTLGSSGIEVPPFAFGGNVFGWTIDENTSFQILDALTGAGLNFIDTADVYSRWVPGNQGGESETIIGNWLKKTGGRDKVVIATKVGSEMGHDKKGLSKTWIKQAVEGSLQRLQTDYIDLYQTHYDDPDTPMEETLATYQELVNEGKVRAIGTSNMTAQRILVALKTSKEHGFPAYQTVQPLYNLYDRESYEKELEPLCQENNLGVISYFSLASGFLTGKYRSEADFSKSQRGKGISKYLNDRGFKILKALDEVSQELNTTPAAVSLAWLINRPGISAPIASATSIEQLNEIIKATELDLNADAIHTLNEASAWE